MNNRVDILLIGYASDDVQRLREAFSETERDFQLHVVRTGEEALDFLHQRDSYTDVASPDIALFDVNAPTIDGEQVLTEVKDDPALQRLPVIVLSRSADNDEVGRAYESQANAYLMNPGDRDEFHDLVDAIDQFWFTHVQLPPPGK